MISLIVLTFLCTSILPGAGNVGHYDRVITSYSPSN
jgi:hypothetical protein